MIATVGEPYLPVPVPESFHEQTDEELTEIDIKQMDADDQAIQTILLHWGTGEEGVENEDSDGEVDTFDDLHVDNSISNSEHEFSESEDSNFNNPSVSLPPPEPPYEELDFEIDFGNEISVVRNTIVEFECIDARVVSNDENDDYSYFMFAKVFSLLFTESEDTIFDPGISV
nr:hypothetical protein [Tanacetum cinerariifolium]